MSDYNYGPLEHELAGGTSTEKVECSGSCGIETPHWASFHDDEPPVPRAGESERVEHSPLPWHVYEGGNFVNVATEGYEDYVNKHHYLGGPFSVASMEYNATPSYKSDHKKAMANAHLIVECVNQHATLIEQRERLVKLLTRALSPTMCYCNVMDGIQCWQCEVREVLITIEQEGGA